MRAVRLLFLSIMRTTETKLVHMTSPTSVMRAVLAFIIPALPDSLHMLRYRKRSNLTRRTFSTSTSGDIARFLEEVGPGDRDSLLRDGAWTSTSEDLARSLCEVVPVVKSS